MGPRVPFALALLTLSLHITLHIYLISSRLLILLYVTCVMVNKAVEKKRKKKRPTEQPPDRQIVEPLATTTCYKQPPLLREQFSKKLYQKFPSQITIHGTSCKRSPLASDHNHF